LIWLIVFGLLLLGADASLANFIELCTSVIKGAR
jgi:hypothetical protein